MNTYGFVKKIIYKFKKTLDNTFLVVYNITVIWFGYIVWPLCGSDSVVECHLAKVEIASSNLVFRSKFGDIAKW